MTRPWKEFSRRRLLLSAGLLLATSLAACADAPPPYRPAAPEFAGPPQWLTPAERIEVEFAPGLTPPAPSVAARLAATPADVAAAWPKRRLIPDPSSTGLVVYTIERAEAVETLLPRKSGVTALFTRDPEAEFKVSFAVALAIFDASGAKRGGASAEASASATLAEGADERERRELWNRLLGQAAANLDQELQRQAPAGLPGLIKDR